MKKFTLILLTTLSLISCKKEGKNNECYDASIVHNNACTADCPGIIGCDGNTYCNKCEAARQGIRPK